MQPITSSKRALWIDLGAVALMVIAYIGMTLYWGLADDGIYHPDEIFQTLEPAHNLVYGFGLSAWEWEFGARNWSLPGVLAGVLGAARLVGVDQPEGYLGVLRAFAAGVFASSGFAVYWLARRYKASRLLAVSAVALFLFNPVTILLGYRALSEVISTPFVLFGLVGALELSGRELSGRELSGQKSAGPKSDAPNHREDAGRWWFVLGISLLSIAVLFRLQNAVFALCVVLPWRFQPAQRARYELAMKVLVGWALVYGVIDWVGWGIPFASAGAYIRFNLLWDEAAANFWVSPPYYYLQTFYTAMGIAGVALLVLSVLAFSRARALLLTTVAFLAMHSFFEHKVFRFILTTIPLFAVLSAVGVQWAFEKIQNTRLRAGAALAVVAAVLAASAWGVRRVPTLTMGELGAPDLPNFPAATPVFDNLGPLNRLLITASARADLCGLYMPEYLAVEAGGHTYFHRDVPFFHNANRPPENTDYNYVLIKNDAPVQNAPRAGWQLIEANAPFALYRTQPEACTLVEGYQTSLFPAEPIELTDTDDDE